MLSAGLGTDNLISVACDELGAMLPSALEAAIVKAKDQGKVGPLACASLPLQ